MLSFPKLGHIFKILKISLNPSVTIQVTSAMDKVLSDVLQALEGKLMALQEWGKPLCFYGFIKSLQSLNFMCFHEVRKKMDVSYFHIFMMDLHDLHKQENFDGIIGSCCTQDKVCVVAASSISESLLYLGY